MSTSSRDLLDSIKSELALLSVQLDSYGALFLLEQDRRAELLAETAPGFFVLHQVAMVESILMRVSRLMDPDFTGKGKYKKENSSFEALVNSVVSNSVNERFCCIIEAWRPGGKFHRIKELRDKWISHNDKELWITKMRLTNKLMQGGLHSDTASDSSEPIDSWVPILHADFDLLIKLSRALWSLMCEVYVHLEFVNKIPPNGMGGEHPVVILRHLAFGRLADKLLDQDEFLENKHALIAEIPSVVGDETVVPFIDERAYRIHRGKP